MSNINKQEISNDDKVHPQNENIELKNIKEVNLLLN
jgi:ABC-type multidrug transport system fused ATPase/permease subunit